jgi:hypothetical protein
LPECVAPQRFLSALKYAGIGVDATCPAPTIVVGTSQVPDDEGPAPHPKLLPPGLHFVSATHLDRPKGNKGRSPKVRHPDRKKVDP